MRPEHDVIEAPDERGPIDPRTLFFPTANPCKVPCRIHTYGAGMAERKFVSYLRVSTDKQGKSGLGLEAQRAAVGQYLNGGRWKLLEESVEVETGKGVKALARRPKLRAAIDACKKNKATLVIAKLGRLARSVAFFSRLMEDKIEFIAADTPSANRLTVPHPCRSRRRGRPGHQSSDQGRPRGREGARREAGKTRRHARQGKPQSRRRARRGVAVNAARTAGRRSVASRHGHGAQQTRQPHRPQRPMALGHSSTRARATRDVARTASGRGGGLATHSASPKRGCRCCRRCGPTLRR